MASISFAPIFPETLKAKEFWMKSVEAEIDISEASDDPGSLQALRPAASAAPVDCRVLIRLDGGREKNKDDLAETPRDPGLWENFRSLLSNVKILSQRRLLRRKKPETSRKTVFSQNFDS